MDTQVFKQHKWCEYNLSFDYMTTTEFLTMYKLCKNASLISAVSKIELSIVGKYGTPAA